MTQEERIALYQERDDKALNIFTGKPLTGDDKDEWEASRDDARGKWRT